MDTSIVREITPNITLSCIAPESRDLLDRIIEECPFEIRNNVTTERFIPWLINDSGLVESAFSVEQILEEDFKWVERMQRTIGRGREDAVYGCAYWLVRWSGLVTSKGDKD